MPKTPEETEDAAHGGSCVLRLFRGQMAIAALVLSQVAVARSGR